MTKQRTGACWSDAHGDAALLVVGTSAVNAVGFNAAQSWAFWRAELTPWLESPFRCPNGKLATMAYVRTLPRKCVGAERIVTLGKHALSELDPIFTRMSRGLRMSVHIGLSERFDRDSGAHLDSQRAQLHTEFTAAILGRHEANVVSFLPRGHASFAYALIEACEALASHEVEIALVGAMDTYYDPLVIRGLIEQQRLFDLEDVDTFIPGEGAAFLLLARRETARELGLEPLARVASSATGEEEATMREGGQSTTIGLSSAMRAAMDATNDAREPFEWVIGDVTNEPYRRREWELLQLEALRRDMVPNRFGDLGAASMATGAVLAAESFVRGAPDQKRCLVAGSSVTSHRGAVLLDARVS